LRYNRIRTHSVGTFENDPRLAVDLIAEVGRGSDLLKIHAIQRMLFNNADNIFEQNAPFNRHNNPKIGNMACGIVAKFRGDQVFGHMTTVDYDHPYHEPLKKSVTKRSDVKYKAKTISSLQTQIVAMLTDEPPKPVRVGVLDDPVGMALVNGKLIAYLAGGHSVLIVGCNRTGTQFLYIDPWGDGSKMEYKGGIAGFTPTGKCRQLGMFELVKDETRLADESDKGRWTLMRQRSIARGPPILAATTSSRPWPGLGGSDPLPALSDFARPHFVGNTDAALGHLHTQFLAVNQGDFVRAQTHTAVKPRRETCDR
jgi:hypothetical protein